MQNFGCVFPRVSEGSTEECTCLLINVKEDRGDVGAGVVNLKPDLGLRPGGTLLGLGTHDPDQHLGDAPK